MSVDTSYFRPDEQQPEPGSMIYTGYYEHFPNEDAVVYFVREIFPLIRRRIPNAKFYIVGSHPSDVVWELGRLDNVVVTGRVTDLRPWLARATVFVAPIRLGRGMRGKILEAMAMKRPVVGSSVALAGFGVTDGQEALIADEPSAFAERVVRVLTDPSLRDRIAEGGYELVRAKYDWGLQVQAYHRLYCWLGDRARRVEAARGQGGRKGTRSLKSVFDSPMLARLNNFLLPFGLGYLTPKALWMLLAAHLRESYRDYLRRSGRRPWTWGIPPLEFGFTFGSPTRASAASDDRPPRGLNEARRLLAEREELITPVSRRAAAMTRFEEELFVARAAMVTLETRACDLDLANRRLMDEVETEKTAAEVATADVSEARIHSDEEDMLKRRSLESRNQAEPSEAREESVWDNLRTRARALEAKLSGLKVRAAELEAGLDKLRQDQGHHEVHARRESAAGR
jgi:hypothetical protein